MAFALSLPWFLRPKPKAPPSPEDVRKVARFNWLNDRDAPTFLQYVRLEPDETLRVEAAFQFLFIAGNETAVGELFTVDMRKAAAWPHARKVVESEFRAVEPVLRPLLQGLTSLDTSLLQNICVASATHIRENRGLLLQLCLERMSLIHSTFNERISPAAAEVAVAFALEQLAEVTSHNSSISDWWRRMLQIAGQLATHRSPPTLTDDELLCLRQALVSSAPHYAQVVQELLMTRPT